MNTRDNVRWALLVSCSLWIPTSVHKIWKYITGHATTYTLISSPQTSVEGVVSLSLGDIFFVFRFSLACLLFRENWSENWKGIPKSWWLFNYLLACHQMSKIVYPIFYNILAPWYFIKIVVVKCDHLTEICEESQIQCSRVP